MRLELPDGQWAELRERLSYGDARAVRLAFLEARESNEGAVGLDLELCRAYLVDWRVIGLDGGAVGFGEPGKAPDDVVQAVAAACIEIWNGKPDPKGTNGVSGSTLQKRGSRSATTS